MLRETPHDLDYQVVCSGFSQRFTYNKVKEDGTSYDIFIIDRDALSRELTFGNPYYFKADLKIYNYFHAIRETIYGECDLPYDMLEYSDVYLPYIKTHYAKKTVIGSPLKYKYGKFYVHYYMVLKIFENQSIVITEDMRADLELLYSNSKESHLVIDWVVSQINSI